MLALPSLYSIVMLTPLYPYRVTERGLVRPMAPDRGAKDKVSLMGYTLRYRRGGRFPR